MKMDAKLVEGINNQINHEFASAYLYYAMSTYFVEITLDGFAKLMLDQAKEELTHAQKLYDYLVMRNEKIVLKRIEAPDQNWVNTPDAIRAALEHEQFVTQLIHELYRTAKETNDHAAEIFLQWFIEEQVEEEYKFQSILDRIKNVEECSCGIEHMDQEYRLADIEDEIQDN